jgi:ABC-type transport system involved in multi-copper enzyme maturation permease subunit
MNRLRTPPITHILRPFRLPLFARELVQQAARRQTYLIRTAYAVLLFSVCAVLVAISLRSSLTRFGWLGQGAALLRLLVNLQFAGVYLFMPALTCGVISEEKERGTFGLLLLTPLGPTAILLEKLLSRLATMGSFLLLSLPLLAFAFTLGGVEAGNVWMALWFLVLTAVLVGCLSLICSSRCHRTVAALLATYLVELVAFGLPAWHWFQSPPAATSFDDYWLFAPAIYSAIVAGASGGVLRASLPMLGASLICLVLARSVVLLHAFPSGVGLRTRLRRLMARPRSNRIARPQSDPEGSLPQDDPVAWLERRRNPFGVGSLTVFVLLEAAIVLVCFSSQKPETLPMMMWSLWILALVWQTAAGASLIGKERSQQTFDVLLSTPLSSREILLQKLAGIRRNLRPIWGVFLTAVVLSACNRPYDAFTPHPSGSFPAVAYIVCSVVTFAIYMPLFTWLSCWIGLRSKNQMRAVITALVAGIAWCVLTFVLVVIPVLEFSRPFETRYILLISPVSLVILNEIGGLGNVTQLGGGSEVAPLLINSLLYFTCLQVIRRKCLDDADRCFGRLHESSQWREVPADFPGG